MVKTDEGDQSIFININILMAEFMLIPESTLDFKSKLSREQENNSELKGF